MTMQELTVNYNSIYDSVTIEDLKQEIRVLESSIEASQKVIEELSRGTITLGEVQLSSLYQELQMKILRLTFVKEKLKERENKAVR